MDTEDLNQIQNSSEQLPRENGSEMIPSLEEEADPDQTAGSGMRVSREIKSGTAANL